MPSSVPDVSALLDAVPPYFFTKDDYSELLSCQ